MLPSTRSRKQRFFTLLRKISIFVALGLGYAELVRHLGFGIPCPFHALTGLDCPGCGISRMFLALLRLDFRAAWEANCALLAALPAATVYAAYRGVIYVAHGTRTLSRGENIAFYVAAALLCVFGVVRNIV